MALPALVLIGSGAVIFMVKKALAESVDQILNPVITQLAEEQQNTAAFQLRLQESLQSNQAAIDDLNSGIERLSGESLALGSQVAETRKTLDLSLSESSSAQTHLQTLIEERLRAQQKLLQELGSTSDAEEARVKQLKQHLDSIGQGLMKLGESSQKLFAGITSHFGELSKETDTLKKAASVQLNRLKSIDELYSRQLQASNDLSGKLSGVSSLAAKLQQSQKDEIGQLASQLTNIVGQAKTQLALLETQESHIAELAQQQEATRQQMLTALEKRPDGLDKNTLKEVLETTLDAVVEKGLKTVLEEGGAEALSEELSEELKATHASTLTAIADLKEDLQSTVASLEEPAPVPLEDLRQDLQKADGALRQLGEQQEKILAAAEQGFASQLDGQTYAQSSERISEALEKISASIQPLVDTAQENSLAAMAQGQASEDASRDLAKEISSSSEALIQSIQGQKQEMHERMEEISLCFAHELNALQEAQQQVQLQHSKVSDLIKSLQGQQLASIAVPAQASSAQVAAGDENDKVRIETPDFVQYLSQCQIERVEDKTTGEVTLFQYRDGLRIGSESYINDVLKRRWLFNAKGQPVQSTEFDAQGYELEQCDYNALGEVIARRSMNGMDADHEGVSVVTDGDEHPGQHQDS